MDLIIKILRLKITKVFLSLLFILFLLSLYFYRNWYKVQYHKAAGFYYVYKGDKAYKNKEHQKAVELYKTALRHYPGHSRASCNLGNIYVSFENYFEAVNYYENALKYSPDFMVCRMNLGIILAEKTSDYDRAVQEYGRVINSKPFTLNIPFIYSNKKAVEHNKGAAYYNTGLAYRGKSVFMGENTDISEIYLKKAKEAYKDAEKYLKDDYDNTFNAALTDHLLGNYAEAAEEYCRAADIKPEELDVHYNFALLLRSMRLYKESLEEFEKALFIIEYFGIEGRDKYIYGIINELKRRITDKDDLNYLKEHSNPSMLDENGIVYSKGRIQADNQKDIDIKSMLKCSYGKKETGKK